MSDTAPKRPVKSNTPAGTVFDVKRPGRAPIQTTSRPVIVGHKSVVRDPFTTGKSASDGPLLAAKQKVTVESTPSPEPTQSPSIDPPEKSAAGAASPELAAIAAELTTQPETIKPDSSAEAPAPSPVSSLVTDAKAEAAAEPKEAPKDYIPGVGAPILPAEPVVKKQAPLSAELKQQLEEVARESNPAPEPKGVVVSGDHGPLDLIKVLLWFISVIVLVAVVGDLLLDAGTITTSVKIPHTNFIK